MDAKEEQDALLASLAELQRAKDWPALIRTLRRIAKVDPDTRKRSKYLYVIGVIYRDELRDVGAAREAFEEALALDPDNRNSKRALGAL